MQLNEDVLLKIYNEFLNLDLETKSQLRHACSFIFRNYNDPRFVEINHDILLHYFNYLLSKPQSTTTTTTTTHQRFKEFQQTFSSFQNLRFQHVSSSCVEDFFEVVLKEFLLHPNLMHELYSFFHPKPKMDGSITSTSSSFSSSKKIDTHKKVIPFQLLYNNTDSQKRIIQAILKLAMEQGLQRNTMLSFEDFTYQQRIALEGLFEAFYNILYLKLDCQLHFTSIFGHLRCFELYNCQCNYTIYIPFSPYLSTIKVVDSNVRLVVDGALCPRLKRLLMDEEASLKLMGGEKMEDFDTLEMLQLRNITFFGTPQLPTFHHLKSLRLNNFPTVNVTLPSMTDLQELFVQDSQLCDQIYIRPQPNLKFLRLWNYHSCLSLVNEDIQYIYSNYGSSTTSSTTTTNFSIPYTHRSSTSSTTSTLSNQSTFTISSTSTAATSSSLFSDMDSFIDYPSYFPKLEYLRLGYCSNLFFIKQLSQRIFTMVPKPSTSSSAFSTLSSSDDTNINVQPPERSKLRRFNLLFPNLKTLVIERSSDLVNYLKWFVPTLSLLTTLIFKDCYWGGGHGTGLQDPLDPFHSNQTSSGDDNLSTPHEEEEEDRKRNEEEEEEAEEKAQERIEQDLLLHSHNLQAVLQKMRFPTTLTEIIFINCSQDLYAFIKGHLHPRYPSLKFNDIQCNEQQLKKWWAMF